MMGKTFRLIDDITTINSDDVFSEHVSNIYPKSLILNKENGEDSKAHVLDLRINIVEGNFDVDLYDKRDDFPFDIVQFSDRSSNVPRSTILGVYQSQVIRYFRICSEFDSFKGRLTGIYQKFVKLGFSKEMLKTKFFAIARKHNFRSKWRINHINAIFN